MCTPQNMAMGQNPNRTPSEHPNPHYRLKWVLHLPQNVHPNILAVVVKNRVTPKMGCPGKWKHAPKPECGHAGLLGSYTTASWWVKSLL